MSDKEYFLILPLLLYGLAIADLVTNWRSFFMKERRYLPHVATGFLLLEVAFWNFYRMNHWLTAEMFSTYYNYFRILMPPLIFLLIVAVYTPDAEVTDIRAYFLKYMPIIFGGLALFVASHFLFEPGKNFEARLAMIALLIAAAASRKGWVVYFLLVARVLSWFVAE